MQPCCATDSKPAGRGFRNPGVYSCVAPSWARDGGGLWREEARADTKGLQAHQQLGSTQQAIESVTEAVELQGRTGSELVSGYHPRASEQEVGRGA